MGLRLASVVLVAILIGGISGIRQWEATAPVPVPLESACTLRFRQPGASWTTVRPVERAQDPGAFYDYYSASAHTEFVEAFVSKAYFYRDTATGRLYLFVHHNIDEAGSNDATVDFDFSGLPVGVGVVLSDDPGELQLGRPVEGQWHFWLNTDGGVLGAFPASGWDVTIAPTWGGPEPMTAWRFVDGSGTHYGLDMAKSLEVASVCNEAPTAAAGGPYAGVEGSPIMFDAGKSSDPDGDALTYSWDWDNDGGFDETTTAATVPHTWPDDFNGVVILRVSDGSLSSTSAASVAVANAPPAVSIDPSGIPTALEGGTTTFDTVVTDPGADTIQVTWAVEGLGSVTRTYFTGAAPTSFSDLTSWTVGDDGSYVVTITATDDDGGSARLDATLDVTNANPIVSLEPALEPVALAFRIAGEKWHDVSVSLFDRSGVHIGGGSVTRMPGSPDDQLLDLGTVDVSPASGLRALVVYTPEDDPVDGQPDGANPGWVILTFPDGSEVRIQHMFNVRHTDTYVWDVDLLPAIASHGFSFNARASDPGSDDLTFRWTFGDGTSFSETAYNDGASPDPPKSPGGTFPFGAASTVRHGFASPGTYVVTVVVTDDDGGLATVSVVITIP